MMTPTFRSSLAQSMIELVAFKRMEGFDYTGQAKILGLFDAFLCEQGYCQSTLNQEIVDTYIAQTANLGAHGRYNRLSTVRVLSRYMHQLDPSNYKIREIPVKFPKSHRWYLYSNEDIAALLKYAKTLEPAGSLRPHTYFTLIGLLYATGLRIKEALTLNIDDLDMNRDLLFVRNGKFGKERFVVMHASVIDAVKRYIGKRNAPPSSHDDFPLFLNASGTQRLGYAGVSKTFRQMIRHCKIGHAEQKLPRLHDLRHTYACNCVLRWYEEGVDVNSKLPILATALGHVDINKTQVYLHSSARLLQYAAQRFHTTFTANCKLQRSVIR
jgi:integrase/recombinase XerD